MRKVVADGRAADVDAAEKTVPAQLHHVIVRLLGEEVAGQFRAIAAMRGAIINKLEHVHLFAGRDGLRVRLAAHRGEELAAGVSRKAEEQARRALALEGLAGSRAQRWKQRRAGGGE